MSNNPRCLYDSSIAAFINADELSILGTLCDHYHGDARTTTRDAWKTEISIMQNVLLKFADNDGRIILSLCKRGALPFLYCPIPFTWLNG